MALLFSAVTVIADDEEMETLVSGIPEEYDDLEGWAVFDDFMDGIASDTVVDVHVETYLYGDGETEKAYLLPYRVMYRMNTVLSFILPNCTHSDP